MFDFIQYVLSELKNSLILAFLLGLAALALLCVAAVIYKKMHKGEKTFPWAKAILWLLFFGYLMIVLYATMLRFHSGFRDVNLHLFRAWREAWNDFSAKSWANVLLNVAMFVPLGFLLPLLSSKLRKWYFTLPIGFGSSGLIELLQLALCRGICDVDDLFANTLGAVIGFFIIMFILTLREEQGSGKKRTVTYGIMAVLPIIAIISIFVVYEAKEYGNLPNAPAFTNYTKDVNWSINCSLPTVETSLPVYRTHTRTIADCDEFAEDFKQIIHTEYNTVSYYQEAAYYMDNGTDGGAHFLHVNYLDQGYTYSASFHDDIPWLDADREIIEQALSQYPIQIPSDSVFRAEGDGWHTFTASQLVENGVFYDGILRVRYAADGTIRKIDNGLLRYEYYDDVKVISAEEAYVMLCDGKFNDGGLLEYIDPTEITVISCELGYMIDTKGFYQPVYVFTLDSTDGRYQHTAMIPAMD